MRQLSTGTQESRRQYIDRNVLQRRKQLYDMRESILESGYGIESKEYKEADRQYRNFVESGYIDYGKQLSLQYDESREAQRIKDEEMLAYGNNGVINMEAVQKARRQQALINFRERKREIKQQNTR